MATTSKTIWLRKLRRSVWFTFLVYPYGFITIPLLVLAVGNFAIGLWRIERPPEFWTWKQTARGALLSLGFVLFSVLSVGNLVVVFLSGWRGQNDGNGA